MCRCTFDLLTVGGESSGEECRERAGLLVPAELRRRVMMIAWTGLDNDEPRKKERQTDGQTNTELYGLKGVSDIIVDGAAHNHVDSHQNFGDDSRCCSIGFQNSGERGNSQSPLHFSPFASPE